MDFQKESEDNVKSFLSSGARIVLSAFGPPGAIISSAWSEIVQQREATNNALFRNKFEAIAKCHSRQIDELRKDVDRLKQGITIVDQSMPKILQEWEEKKIPQYANLIWNCIISQDDLDKKIKLIEQFSHLSIKDIEILQEFEDGRKTLKECCYCHYEKDYLNSIVPSVVKLTSSWLLEETDQEIAGFTVVPQDSKWSNKYYKLTPYGQALITLIQDPGKGGAS